MPRFVCNKSFVRQKRETDVKCMLLGNMHACRTHMFLNVASLIGLIRREMVHRNFRCGVWIRLGQPAHCVILFH